MAGLFILRLSSKIYGPTRPLFCTAPLFLAPTSSGFDGALTGIAGVLGKNVIGRMHEAGMEKVSDLIRQAMLDPELARVLLSKAPAKPDTGSAMTLAHWLRRLSVYAPTQATTSDRKGDR